MEETEQWTYVSGNEESLQSWEERHLTQAVGLQEETSSRMIIWSFVLPNITLTVPDQSVFALSCMTFYQSLLCVFLPFKNPSASKGYLYSQVALFGKATCTVRWLSLGSQPSSYSSESFVIVESELH